MQVEGTTDARVSNHLVLVIIKTIKLELILTGVKIREQLIFLPCHQHSLSMCPDPGELLVEGKQGKVDFQSRRKRLEKA